MTRARGVYALGLAAVVSACAQPNRPPVDDFDSKSWEAQKALLPPYPKQGSLMSFYVGPAMPFEFFVDSASVSLGQDGMVRYTLVARSPSAAVNVTYEGIRCQSREHRRYAFGASDGTWFRARNSEWVRIGQQANPQLALAEDFFCSSRVQTAEDALQALARGNRPGQARPTDY